MSGIWPTPNEIEKARKSEFERLALGPYFWRKSAEILKRAADILIKIQKEASSDFSSKPIQIFTDDSDTGKIFRDTKLLHTYYLLIGLSIENLVKGIIISNHPEYLVNGILTEIDTHYTYNLLTNHKIYQFQMYKDVLNQLTKYVMSKGRYHVPLNSDDYDYVDDIIEPREITELYEKLHKRLIREELVKRLRDKGIANVSIKDFLDIKECLKVFMEAGKNIENFMDAYTYPWLLVKYVAWDYRKDLSEGDLKKKMWLQIERYEIEHEKTST